jgi:hypothetical protein
LIVATATPIAVLEDAALVLRGFKERDTAVLGMLEQEEDLARGVHRCLQVGARALNGARAQLDVDHVQRAFSELRASFEAQVDSAGASLNQLVADTVGSDDGQLQQSIAQFRQDLANELAVNFDPRSRDSVLAKVEVLLAEARRDQVQALARVLDPTCEDSPLGRYRMEILRAVREESEQVRRAVNEVSEKVAVREGQAQLQERCSTKGVSFEGLVHEALSVITAAQGDLAGQTGTETGDDGVKVGDEVVLLNPEISCGRDLRYVIEVKDRSMSMAAIHAELDRALTNRQAGAAIAVFSSQTGCPGAQPFQWFANKALVVLDKEHPDTSALCLATAWARWVLCRDLVAVKEGIDLQQAEAAIKDAARALERVSTIRRCHGVAAKKIAEAGDQVSGLHHEVQDALARLGEVLSCS